MAGVQSPVNVFKIQQTSISKQIEIPQEGSSMLFMFFEAWSKPPREVANTRILEAEVANRLSVSASAQHSFFEAGSTRIWLPQVVAKEEHREHNSWLLVAGH